MSDTGNHRATDFSDEPIILSRCCPTCDALAAECAALREERAPIVQRAENAEAALVAEVAKNGRHAMRVTIAQLEARLAEVEALRKDAERYRWLRDSAGNDIMEKLMAECSPPRWDELVDAAIDAAMGERP